MAETHQYVNRSNLATFLAKIKELIPSSLTFLTKTEAEETYQEKLKYYEEKEEGRYHDVVIGSSEVRNVEIESGTDFNVSAGGSIDIESAGGAAIELEDRFAMLTNGSADLTIEGTHAYFNGVQMLTESNVIDSLESTSTTAPLSANQGKVLNEKFDDILTKSDVMTDTNVAMLSRMFALPLSSYVGAGLYQPSTDTIGKYTEMFNSLDDGELVVCEYQGVKGLYKYQGGTQLYCFSQWAADLTKIPTGVEDTLTSSSTGLALSANQGKVLNEKIADLQSDVSSLENQFTNQVWIMKNTTTNPISRSLLYPQAGNPAVGDVILGIDYYGDQPVTPLRVTRVNGDDITYTIITEIVTS